MTTPHFLDVENLSVEFRTRNGTVRALEDVTLHVEKGEVLGIVGESGSGKSVTAYSVIGLLDAAGSTAAGSASFDGIKLTGAPESLLRDLRGREISMIFQNPRAALNPFEPVGKQIAEAVQLHAGIKDAAEAREKALYWLEQVRIDSPRLRYNNHPYGLSGGMSQRAMIAMALAAEPHMLIADEPTTGLDATIQARIVDLLHELKERLGMTMVLISHDIGVISRLSDRIAVMYGGRVMETGPATDVLDESADGHPYTRALLSSTPRPENVLASGHLPAIEGEVLDTINVPNGCRFRGRCHRITDGVRARCESEEPELMEVAPGHRIRCWLYAK